MGLKIGILTERMILGYGVDLVVNETSLRLSHHHDVTVFTSRAAPMYMDKPYRVVDLSQRFGSVGDIFLPQYCHSVLPFLQSSTQDVWIIHTPPFYNWIFHFKPPVICVEHGTPPGKFFPRKTGRHLDKTTKERYEKIYANLRPGDGLVAISDFIKKSIPYPVHKNTLTIYNGADHYPRATMEDAAEFRRRTGISEKDILVLWVGRIDPLSDSQPYKGFDEFIRLAGDLQLSHPSMRFMVVGRGGPEAEEYLEKRGIIHHLNLDCLNMPEAFYAADIFISTSKWEGFNLPLVEAQFQGTPVIAYQIGPHSEVVSHGNSGFLVSSFSEMKKALMQLAENKDLITKLGTGARKMSSRFVWDNSVEQLERLIIGCIKESTRDPDAQTHIQPLVKNRRYYFQTAGNILRREGLGVLIKEMWSTFKRRLRS